MRELPGVYLEFDVYSFDDITCEHIGALEALGCEVEWDYKKRIIKIPQDTSTLEHERCGEPMDALEMV